MQHTIQVSIVLIGIAASAPTAATYANPVALGPSEADVFFRRFECAMHFQPAAGLPLSSSSPSSSSSSTAATKICYLRRSDSSSSSSSFNKDDITNTKSEHIFKGSSSSVEPQLQHNTSRISTFGATDDISYHHSWHHIDTFDHSTASALIFPEPGDGRLVFGDG
jgi:hypothetical protein